MSYLILPPQSKQRQTVKRYISTLSTLWAWLETKGVVTANPWRGHGVARKTKQRLEQGRRGWGDAALQCLLEGQYTARYGTVLHDLIRLALVTGARLEELCALKTTDAGEHTDGWWINIREGKTAAAKREVPVHDSAAHILRRRRKSPDGYVFDKLIPGGPDGKRSWHVSKAFGRYTRGLKLGNQRQVFHELRNTFTEAMEAAEVPESTTALLIGHTRSSLTYGHYSKGDRVELRRYIKRLRYSNEVMKL